MTQTPPNRVDIRRSGYGGIVMLLDGYDLAPHIEDWSIARDGIGQVLTVTIPCGALSVDLPDEHTSYPGPSRDVRGGCA